MQIYNRFIYLIKLLQRSISSNAFVKITISNIFMPSNGKFYPSTPYIPFKNFSYLRRMASIPCKSHTTEIFKPCPHILYCRNHYLTKKPFPFVSLYPIVKHLLTDVKTILEHYCQPNRTLKIDRTETLYEESKD